MGMSTSTAPGMNGGLDRIEATPLNGTFGARIDGIDLSRPLGSQAIERLKEFVRQHKVLTFRDQFAVDRRNSWRSRKASGRPRPLRIRPMRIFPVCPE